VASGLLRLGSLQAFPPLVEAFLIIEQPRQRLGHWTRALAALDDVRAPALATIAAYYDAPADQALIGLRYDELALGRDGLAFLVDIALLAEVGMIQPATLTEGDRRRFLGERLARCTIHVADQRSVVGALTELVRRARRGGRLAPPPVPRGDTSEPAPLLHKKPADAVTTEAREAQRAMVQRLPRAPYLPAPPESRADGSQPLPTEAIATAEGSRTEPIMEPGVIYARFLRSGRWVPIRVGALSLRGASLLSGALPRLHDHVDLALSYSGHRALVRGPVKRVSSHEEATSFGAATFSVAFELDDASRRQLTSLLTAARAANVTIKPPPARRERRYPVEWPLCLGTMRGAVRADALDVSREGMFVRPSHALALDSLLNFSVVLDDASSPIAGRAKVVRLINETDARTCGLAPGYGLSITEMGEADHERWIGFLGRVAKRAEKRVLVGAAPARLSEIQGWLAAAGYAVTGGTDPGALVQLAGAEQRPVDAALIDASWLVPNGAASWVETLFASRNVPCVTIQGDARRARATVDRVLEVG
jgi:PilZ domain-containing protein